MSGSIGNTIGDIGSGIGNTITTIGSGVSNAVSSLSNGSTTSLSIGGAVLSVKNVLKIGVGATGSFTTPTGQIVTVQNGIITNIF